MIHTVQEKLEAWVLVDAQAPQPTSSMPPAEPTATCETTLPRPRALHTVGLGLTGPQVLHPFEPMLTRIGPKLEAYLFLRHAYAAPQPVPVVPGTPADLGYEADDEDDYPLSLGLVQRPAAHKCAVTLAHAPTAARSLM